MLKKVMEDRVLRSLALRPHIVRTVQDTSTLNTGEIQLSVVEDGCPEMALKDIINQLNFH